MMRNSSSHRIGLFRAPAKARTTPSRVPTTGSHAGQPLPRAAPYASPARASQHGAYVAGRTAGVEKEEEQWVGWLGWSRHIYDLGTRAEWLLLLSALPSFSCIAVVAARSPAGLARSRARPTQTQQSSSTQSAQHGELPGGGGGERAAPAPGRARGAALLVHQRRRGDARQPGPLRRARHAPRRRGAAGRPRRRAPHRAPHARQAAQAQGDAAPRPRLPPHHHPGGDEGGAGEEGGEAEESAAAAAGVEAGHAEGRGRGRRRRGSLGRQP